MTIILLLLLSSLLIVTRYHACNEITYRDRRLILWCVFDYRRPLDECNQLMIQYESVSYGNHLWYLFTFRDPMKLYGSLLNSKFDLYYSNNEI